MPPGEPVGPAIPYAGLDIALIDVPQQEGQLDLLLRVEQTPEGVTTVFSYDTDVLDRATVERLADGYERLLAAAVHDPDTLVADVELAAEADLDALLALGSGVSGFGDTGFGDTGFGDTGFGDTGFNDFDSFETAWDYR